MQEKRVSDLIIYGSRLLVLVEPRKMQFGNIVLPDLKETVIVQEGVGKVIKKGDGRDIWWQTAKRDKYAPIEPAWSTVKVGDRILFRQFLKDAGNITTTYSLFDFVDDDSNVGEYCILDVRDVLLTLSADVDVGYTVKMGLHEKRT